MQVETEVQDRPHVDRDASLLRHWRRFIDECRIRQLAMNEPVALGFCSNEAKEPCLVKNVREFLFGAFFDALMVDVGLVRVLLAAQNRLRRAASLGSVFRL